MLPQKHWVLDDQPRPGCNFVSNIQDVLHEENGYLENGALTVEYGIHVDAMEFLGVWKFILSRRMFDCEEGHKKIICNFGDL